MAADLVSVTSRGLFCREGNFYIDPWAPVETALITHAHSDHARPGSAHYFTATSNAPLLRKRLGDAITLDGLSDGESLRFNGVEVSFHPGGTHPGLLANPHSKRARGVGGIGRLQTQSRSHLRSLRGAAMRHVHFGSHVRAAHLSVARADARRRQRVFA